MAVEEKNNYCTQLQKETLVNLMKEKENEPLLSGKFSSTFSFKDARSKWQNIASILNSAPGASKDWKQWKKTWQDLRCKAKKKKSDQVRHARGTGGGPPLDTKYETTDELILSTIAPSAITGDVNITETPINFHFEVNDERDEPTMIDIAEEYDVKANEIVNSEDHIYSKENIAPVSSSHPKKRTSASRRLETSATAATTLAEVSQSTLDVQKEYYATKLQLLERQVVAVENLVNFFTKK